jgi:HK97 family phage major capsid protein/HK97 family phage prohead protease
VDVSGTGVVTRGYSLVTVKAVDDEQRTITGIATTPETDRVGDIVESRGAKFRNPLPLLLFHDHTRPVGTLKLSKPTDDGIEFTASLPHIAEPGPLRDRVSEAWQSVKAGLIRGVSIGFRAFDDGVELMKSGGLRFTGFEILELSLVSVPANASATIQTIKSVDAPHLAASGNDASTHTPGVSGTHATARKGARHMKTITEQIKDFEATRAAKSARMTELMNSAAEKGETLDESQSQEYDTLETEVKAVDAHLARLASLEKTHRETAKPVNGETVEKAAASRGGQFPVIQVTETVPQGIGFARSIMCRMAAVLNQKTGEGPTSAVEVAKQRYPDYSPLHSHFQQKAAVPAGTSTQTVWAGPLVYATNLESEFIEFLRPQTVVGKFGQGGVPSLRRVPFNVRIPSQTSGGTGYWVGEGAPKPLTSFAFTSTTLGYTKVAAISVITQELARFSSPSAEMLVRDSLAAALVERIDRDFIDPAEAGTANVQPASLTNGLTALTSAGTSADNARTDVGVILREYLQDNQSVAGLVFIMPNTLAMALSLQVNSLGQPEFPALGANGGSLMGIPVITSQYAANASGGGNLVIAVNAPEVFLADDGQVTVDASQEATLQMLDNPTNNSATGTATTGVSMYQTDSIAIRAHRFINWAKRRSTAVVYMDDVNWGSIGSPD